MHNRIPNLERLGVHVANASPNQRASQAVRDAVMFLLGVVATLFVLSWL